MSVFDPPLPIETREQTAALHAVEDSRLAGDRIERQLHRLLPERIDVQLGEPTAEENNVCRSVTICFEDGDLEQIEGVIWGKSDEQIKVALRGECERVIADLRKILEAAK